MTHGYREAIPKQRRPHGQRAIGLQFRWAWLPGSLVSDRASASTQARVSGSWIAAKASVNGRHW
jgi:hypothetical protein